MSIVYTENTLSNKKGDWFSSVTNMTNFANIKNNHLTTSFSPYKKQVLQLMKDKFSKGWKNELFNDTRKADHGNKLRTYRLFKDEFRREDYLIKCTNVSHRRSFAKFRLSAHRLNIEVLRYVTPRIPPENRLCNNCDSHECENEIHFLLSCQKYEDLRESFFRAVSSNYSHFTNLSIVKQFVWLCSYKDTNIIRMLAKYIYDCFERRVQ